MNSLNTREKRLEAINKINDSFIKELISNNIKISDDAVCRVGENSIELGIKAKGEYLDKGYIMSFASEISLYAKNESSNTFRGQYNKINFGSSGSFTPLNQESYWRTIHASEILKNWDISCTIINNHCKMYRDLCFNIFNQNK